MERRTLIVLLTGFLLICIFLLYIFLTDSSGAVEKDNSRVLAHLTTRYSLSKMRQFAFRNALDNEFAHPIMHNQQKLMEFKHIVENPARNRFKLNDGQDVLVFLHIQKTAGTTFEQFLVRHLNIAYPCKCGLGEGKKGKKCQCRRPGGRLWLFSRYSTGWTCGLHADYTELIVSGCVGNSLDTKEAKHHKRRLYLTTFLRDPVERFISEYSHVSERGGTWARSRHVCGGRPPTPDELPMCYDPTKTGWKGAEMDEFLACPYNLGFNRQTRMLADLTLVHCYNTSAMDSTERGRIMLESAKRTLHKSAFFGLQERMEESQFAFEKTFGIRFDGNLAEWNRSKSAHIVPTKAQLEAIRQRNALDLVLYEFAVRLFERRLSLLGWKAAKNNSTPYI